MDFDNKLLVVKIRYLSEDGSGKERVLFYRRDEKGFTGQVFAALSPEDYYPGTSQNQSKEETPAIPILANNYSENAEDETPSFRVRFF